MADLRKPREAVDEPSAGWVILQSCAWGLVCGLIWTLSPRYGFAAAFGLTWVIGWLLARAWLLAILRAMEAEGRG